MIPGEYYLGRADRSSSTPVAPWSRSASTTPATGRSRSGAHYHFFEVNKALVFDRVKAYGMRLDLPSGTSVRFEPGDVKEVKLIPYGGRRVVYGFNGLGQRPSGRSLHSRDQPETLPRTRLRPQAIQMTRRLDQSHPESTRGIHP